MEQSNEKIESGSQHRYTEPVQVENSTWLLFPSTQEGRNEPSLTTKPNQQAFPMGLTYFKRYRMEIDLEKIDLQAPVPGLDYQLWPWHPTYLAGHAEAKYHSFRTEIDANVFSCLGDYEGCLRLMTEISRKAGFLPESTWLLVYQPSADDVPVYCGTVQGIHDRSGMGSIQNLGIVPEHRGRGLGSCLLMNALVGFHRAGLRRAFLEVTSQNEGAIRLYERLGFSKSRTVYKAVETPTLSARD